MEWWHLKSIPSVNSTCVKECEYKTPPPQDRISTRILAAISGSTITVFQSQVF